MDQKVGIQELQIRLRELINTISKLDEPQFILFKTWAKNIITRGMTGEEKEKVSSRIDEGKEVETMVYNLERLMREERMEGLIKGRVEGRVEGRMEIADRMFRKGMSIDEIAEITGIPEEDLKKLSESN